MTVRGLVRRHFPATVAILWCIGTAIALAVTLHALAIDPNFDGLQNILQIPFALPWFYLPIFGILSHQADAWITAALGWVNGLLIYLWLRHLRSPAVVGPSDR